MSDSAVIEYPELQVEEVAQADNRMILVVDDSALNRMMIEDILGGKYKLIEAEDGVQALKILEERGTDIALVLLDLNMPNLDGFGVLEVMNQRGWIRDIPVIVITAESAYEFVERTYDLGVTDFIRRPFDARVVDRRITNTIALYNKQRRLADMVTSQIFEKEKNTNLLVSILGHIVEFRNGESGLHVMHIGKLTDIFLQELAKITDKYDLSTSERNLIVTAAALHDIGKISIDNEILNKPGKLTDEEFNLMKEHTVIGYDILAGLPISDQSPLIRRAMEICRWHHERYDGRGYPDGLSGDGIPIGAQIVALADVYDALSSERCYKPALEHDTVMQMILNGECGAFNPLLLECLVAAENRIVDEYENAVYFDDDKDEMNHLLNEIQDSNDLSVLSHALEMLDCERQKNDFIRKTSSDLEFDYTFSTDLLSLSKSAAEYLGLPEMIPRPGEDQDFAKIFGRNTFNEVVELVRSSTSTDPVVSTRVTVNLNDEEISKELIVRSIWSQDSQGQEIVYGAIGVLR